MPTAIILLLCCCLTGCNIYQSIYKPRHDRLGTPADRGLDFSTHYVTMTDGVRLHSWLVPAADRNAPLVVLFHGTATDLSHQLPMIEFLRDLGAAVFAYDYRGFGFSEGRSTNAEQFYRDARTVRDWLTAGGHDRSPIIYDGRSLGASVALQLALDRPPDALMMECAFSSLGKMGLRLRPFLYIHGGWAFLGDAFDNLAKIDRLTVPLYLIHGRRDAVVPYGMAQALFERAPEPKAFYLVTDGEHCNDHPFSEPGYRTLWANILTLLKRGRTLTGVK